MLNNACEGELRIDGEVVPFEFRPDASGETESINFVFLEAPSPAFYFWQGEFDLLERNRDELTMTGGFQGNVGEFGEVEILATRQ